MNDPILDTALQDLESTAGDIETAELLLKVLSEAGEDVTVQRGELATLKNRRGKMILSLKNNGAGA